MVSKKKKKEKALWPYPGKDRLWWVGTNKEKKKRRSLLVEGGEKGQLLGQGRRKAKGRRESMVSGKSGGRKDDGKGGLDPVPRRMGEK